VPDDGTVIFSAHGVRRSAGEAERRSLQVFEPLPLVPKYTWNGALAREARSHPDRTPGTPEVEGTWALSMPPRAAFYCVQSLEMCSVAVQHA